mgnify:CR=1 FL=1
MGVGRQPGDVGDTAEVQNAAVFRPGTKEGLVKSGNQRRTLAAGGRGEARPLTERDRWIAEQVGPALRERGLLFVGLDVIGDYLTEINVTSPTCIREIDAAYDTDIGGRLMDAIEELLQAR